MVGLDCGVAKNRPDDEPVAPPHALRRRLIAAGRSRSDAAHRVGRAIGGFQSPEHSAKRCGVDAVALPLELNALQTAGRLVHLVEHDKRQPARRDIAAHDLHVAVAEINRPRQHRRAPAELHQ